MVDGMQAIKKKYANQPIDVLRTSQPFAREWQTLFDDIGPELWPTMSSIDVEPTADPEYYPRWLAYDDIHDRIVSVASVGTQPLCR